MTASAATTTPRHPVHRAVALGYAGMFVYGFLDNTRGPIFPDILSDFGLSDTVGGLFFLVASAAVLANNVLLFRWIEHIGANQTLRVYSVVQLAGLLIIGFSQRFGITLVGCVLIGLSFGGIGIATNVVVTEAAHGHVRRQWLSGLHAMYGISSLLAPLWVTALYWGGLGWRATLGWLGVGSIFVCALSFTMDLGSRRTMGLRQLLARRTEATAPVRPLRAAVYYSLLCTCYVVAELVIGTRLPLYVRREAGYTVEAANLLLSAYFLGLFLGRFLFALRSSPWGTRSILFWSAGSGLACCVLGLTYHPGWLAVAGFCFSLFYPATMALIGEEHSANGTTAFVTSWCVTLQSVGVIAMHVSLSGLSDRFDLGLAMWLGPAALVATLMLLAVKERFAPVPISGA